MLSACKLIGVLATGTNNLDLQAIREAGVKRLRNVPGYGVADVAQHALALLLEICNNKWPGSPKRVRQGSANGKGAASGVTGRKRRFAFPGTDNNGHNMGFGAIGQATGRLANALGMEVLAASRNKTLHSRAGIYFCLHGRYLCEG